MTYLILAYGFALFALGGFLARSILRLERIRAELEERTRTER
jgi:hypothetical protein